jgi:hypothetical protein
VTFNVSCRETLFVRAGSKCTRPFNGDQIVDRRLQVGNTIPVNVIMFLPAALLGFIGGILGAVFTIANLKISRIRRRLIARVKQPTVQNIIRCIEPPFIMVRFIDINITIYYISMVRYEDYIVVWHPCNVLGK